MIRNYKIKIVSNSSLTQVALATSRLVLALDEKSKNGDNNIVVLSVNTSRADRDEGDIVFQVSAKNSNSGNFDFNELNDLIDKIEKEYNVKIILC